MTDGEQPEGARQAVASRALIALTYAGDGVLILVVVFVNVFVYDLSEGHAHDALDQAVLWIVRVLLAVGTVYAVFKMTCSDLLRDFHQARASKSTQEHARARARDVTGSE